MKYILLILLVFTFSACSDYDADKKENPLKKTAEENKLKAFEPELKYTVVQNTVGQASTRIFDQEKNRMKNIELSINRINAITIDKGAEFSFNDTVGERSEEKGFEEAPVIIEGKHSCGLGGGVCQVSSTLYMAAKRAGLWIKERHSHSKPVPYADKNNDATVVFGSKDFKFVNTKEYPLTLYLWIENGNLYAKIVSNEEHLTYE